jgi:hypothetical protein
MVIVLARMVVGRLLQTNNSQIPYLQNKASEVTATHRLMVPQQKL